MLARFRDAEGKERWVNVEIDYRDTVRRDGRRVVFIVKAERASVEETASPARMRDSLGMVKLELEGMFEEDEIRAGNTGGGRKPAVRKESFIRRVTRLLGVDRWEAAALLDESEEITASTQPQ
jgi:hypothetical protein